LFDLVVREPEHRIPVAGNECDTITGDGTQPGILDGMIVPETSACFIHFTGRGWVDPETGTELLLPVDARPAPDTSGCRR